MTSFTDKHQHSCQAVLDISSKLFGPQPSQEKIRVTGLCHNLPGPRDLMGRRELMPRNRGPSVVFGVVVHAPPEPGFFGFPGDSTSPSGDAFARIERERFVVVGVYVGERLRANAPITLTFR